MAGPNRQYEALARQMYPIEHPMVVSVPANQDTAIVLCGGGDPTAELIQAKQMASAAGRRYRIYAGNDQIEHCPEEITAVTLHPDKLHRWIGQRRLNGFPMPEQIWSHHKRNGGITDATRDWQGSTGLFAYKVAREHGYTHVVLCGVHMSAESGHFVRKTDWPAATGFLRGWVSHMQEIKPFARAFGGWTREQLGEPTVEWLATDVAELFTQYRPGEKA